MLPGRRRRRWGCGRRPAGLRSDGDDEVAQLLVGVCQQIDVASKRRA